MGNATATVRLSCMSPSRQRRILSTFFTIRPFDSSRVRDPLTVLLQTLAQLLLYLLSYIIHLIITPVLQSLLENSDTPDAHACEPRRGGRKERLIRAHLSSVGRQLVKIPASLTGSPFIPGYRGVV
jgi:hypothetical protein